MRGLADSAILTACGKLIGCDVSALAGNISETKKPKNRLLLMNRNSDDIEKAPSFYRNIKPLSTS
jgi:hypothetical protein